MDSSLWRQGDYWKSDATHCQQHLIVQDIELLFNFQDNGVAASESQVSATIQKTLFEYWWVGGNNAPELDKKTMATENQRVHCDKGKPQVEAVVVESFASEPHVPMPNRDAEPTALSPDNFLMEKPVACYGNSWHASPGNTMFRESLYTAHEKPDMPKSEQRVSIIDTLMEQYYV
jgi:hypothetical protein